MSPRPVPPAPPASPAGRCPLCGAPNGCAIAPRHGAAIERAAQPLDCWCLHTRIAPAALARARQTQPEQCLCRACATGHKPPATRHQPQGDPMSPDYQPETMTRAQAEQLPGTVLLDFGANWCSICKAARAHVEAALAEHPQVRHIRIEDGKGRPLGREFGVKLWPSLFLLRDGQVQAQVVRPESAEAVRAALAAAALPGSA
ncbi:cysteine-rich CWC family protein [Vandammella animalimorsus]